jgi:cell division septal protein FtsQ
MKLKRSSSPKAAAPKAPLKPQPRVRAGGARGAKRPSARPRGRGRGARRPGTPLRRRLAGRLPSLRRVLAGVGAVACAAGLIALVMGPWLRVTEVTWAGERFTPSRDLERVLDRQRGVSLMALDTGALRDQLARLPAVADAAVTTSLPGRVEVAIIEREAAFVWETASARLLGSSDGILFAALRRGDSIGPELADLPLISDRRGMARLMTTGDRIPSAQLSTALRLAGLDPAALGSRATAVSVRIDDEFGFGLASSDPGWEMALGAYGMDPGETSAEAAARLERQITAVRTLFATRAEAEIGWVDARNPGKVYFRAKG